MSFEENLKNFRFADDSRDVFDACLRFAAFLQKNGVKELQIYLDDAFKFYAAFFGSLLAGATPYVLAKPIFEANLTAVSDENFLNFLENEPAGGLKFDRGAKFYLQTSGSSGKSKMIEKSLAQMIKESEYLASELKFSAQNTFFSSVSHRHMFGLTFKVFLPLVLGARVVADELNYPEAIVGLELAGHVFIASPVLLGVLAQNEKAGALAPLSGIISAGSHLKDELRAALGKICAAPVIEIYGSTETGIVAKDGGGGLRLFSAVSAGLDEREALNVRSPWCEFFQSNDWAQLAGDKLALKGRIDRIIKLNDKRVSLESIEAKLLQSGLLADCYCAPHPRFKRVAALLELNAAGLKAFRKIGKKGVADALKELLRLEFKNNVRYFKIVEKMPRNQQGKFEKREFENALFANTKPVWNGGAVNEVGEICRDLTQRESKICEGDQIYKGGNLGGCANGEVLQNAANGENLRSGKADLDVADFKNDADGEVNSKRDGFTCGIADFKNGDDNGGSAHKISNFKKSADQNGESLKNRLNVATCENESLCTAANAQSFKNQASGERMGQAPQRYEFSAVMHVGLEVFESHFPNLPLLPGFVQLDYVFELANRASIDVGAASSVENLKFMKFVRPGDLLRVCFEKRGGKLYFELFCNGEKCSVGRASL